MKVELLGKQGHILFTFLFCEAPNKRPGILEDISIYLLIKKHFSHSCICDSRIILHADFKEYHSLLIVVGMPSHWTFINTFCLHIFSCKHYWCIAYIKYTNLECKDWWIFKSQHHFQDNKSLLNKRYCCWAATSREVSPWALGKALDKGGF